MINHEPSSLQRRSLFAGLAAFGASAAIGNSPAMAKVEQNVLKRRGVGLRALDSELARGLLSSLLISSKTEPCILSTFKAR
jgi:hypothetical protein